MIHPVPSCLAIIAKAGAREKGRARLFHREMEDNGVAYPSVR
jgi:hypothetical protein